MADGAEADVDTNVDVDADMELERVGLTLGVKYGNGAEYGCRVREEISKYHLTGCVSNVLCSLLSSSLSSYFVQRERSGPYVASSLRRATLTSCLLSVTSRCLQCWRH